MASRDGLETKKLISMLDNFDIVDEIYNEQPPEPEPPPDESNLLIAPPRKRWTVAELLDAEFPEPKWAIPDLIPEGLTIIGGRPKIGKSWLLLQAAIAVGSGGRFFGKQVEQGNVLYVAFEDGPRRLQDRLRKMGMPRDALVTFERVWRPMQNGGLDDLVAELAAVDYRLVIFDTLTRAFPGLSQKDRPEIIGSCIDNIQTIATNRNISITFSDHTRKPNGFDSDPIDDILYSSEKVKSADVVLALYKEQGKSGAKLLGRGREIETVDLALQWDPELWCWQCKGNNDEVQMTAQELDILEALKSYGKARMTDIASATGINKGSVYRILMNLWTNGKIHKDNSGKDTFYEVKQPYN
jgi:RecA-family ATPase